MSGIVTVPVLIPLLPISAPLMIGVAGAAALALGFSAAAGAGVSAAEKAANSVDLAVNNADEVAGNLNLAQSLTFARDGVKLTFARDAGGRVAVRVEGELSKAELRRIGERAAQALVQQYAYHRLVTELKSRGMNVVDEYADDDGAVRLKARVYQS